MARFEIDPTIAAFGDKAYDTPLIKDVWKKYYWPKANEKSPEDVYQRVAKAIAASPAEHIGDPHNYLHTGEAEEAFYEMMSKRLFLPGGRILAGAGTNKRVTLMNCYVNGTLEDSIEGISRGKRSLLVTSAMGGGVGTDFSPLRPLNAIIGDPDSNSASSGAISFMDTFNADGKTIRSAGERRAAQMGTLSDTHPDLPIFIKAKGEGLKDGTKRLAEFNVSILTSDAFMAAVEDDEEWLLYFHIPPRARSAELEQLDFVDDNGVKQYVYSVWKARELFDLITQYTYEFSDPGTIFIDRINDLNNLYYCEEIRCTNPCGEQPLPPNGTCNLGAINVANCIRRPFTDRAEVDFDLLGAVAKWGVRFLDNVIDVTSYPLPEQEEEELAKRRIGLGIFGLGTAFAELGVRYGSQKSIDLAEKIMKCIAIAAYQASVELAKERGAFPYFDNAFLDAEFVKSRLPSSMVNDIKVHGIRNGVLLTIAPVGTGSIVMGSLSSGIEPDFDHAYERNVRRNNTEEFDKYTEKSYTARFYEFCTKKEYNPKSYPDFMETALNIDIIDHIKIQGIMQKWVDASISKTINIPADYPYEKFVEVYKLAYMYGCKGCTTYRPSEFRESILSTTKESKQKPTEPLARPSKLSGSTYKVKWPSMTASMYITINYQDSKPYEVFFASKDAKYQDWMTGVTLMLSGTFRSGIDPSFIPDELKQVVSAHDTGWVNGKHYGSLIAYIGHIIEQDFIEHNIIPPKGGQEPATFSGPEKMAVSSNEAQQVKGDLCPSCRAPTYFHKEGCGTCNSCGYSQC